MEYTRLKEQNQNDKLHPIKEDNRVPLFWHDMYSCTNLFGGVWSMRGLFSRIYEGGKAAESSVLLDCLMG